jgi:hypothetical protein
MQLRSDAYAEIGEAHKDSIPLVLSIHLQCDAKDFHAGAA